MNGMEIDGDTIVWKSTPELYEAEARGDKDNTVRFLPVHGRERRCLVAAWDHLTKIKIVEVGGQRSFTRTLTSMFTRPHKCPLYEGDMLVQVQCYIFSWDHPEAGHGQA